MDAPCPPGDQHLRLRLPSRPDSIGIVRARVGAFVRSHGLSLADEIVVAACHMSANAVLHAFRSPGAEPEFEVAAELLADRLAARIRRSQDRSGGQPGNFGSVFG